MMVNIVIDVSIVKVVYTVNMVNMVKIVIRLSFWLSVYKTLRSTFIE